MALYFYCAGDVQASGNNVTCSVPVQSYTPDPGLFSVQTFDLVSPYFFYFFAIWFGTNQIIKAIQQG
jgi:hypothetical protein